MPEQEKGTRCLPTNHQGGNISPLEDPSTRVPGKYSSRVSFGSKIERLIAGSGLPESGQLLAQNMIEGVARTIVESLQRATNEVDNVGSLSTGSFSLNMSDELYLSRTQGEVIKAWREYRGLTNLQTTVQASLPNGHLSKIESDKVNRPNNDMLARLARTFDIPLMALVIRAMPQDEVAK